MFSVVSMKKKEKKKEQEKSLLTPSTQIWMQGAKSEDMCHQLQGHQQSIPQLHARSTAHLSCIAGGFLENTFFFCHFSSESQMFLGNLLEAESSPSLESLASPHSSTSFGSLLILELR